MPTIQVSVCLFIIAAAELNRDLADFLQWFQQNRGKKMPNLSELGRHGMPAGAGRKGSKVAKKKAPRKRNPTDENRVPLDTTPQPCTSSDRRVLSPVEYNIHVNAAGMSSVSTPILQLLSAVIGRGTVVHPLEQHILVTVIGTHTPI